MPKSETFKAVEKIIEYEFKDKHILERALTHSSTGDEYNYQRLEFLGDRVLGLVIAGALFTEFRQEQEGGLAKRHTALVQGKTLAMIGVQHNIGDYMMLSDAERSAGGHKNENIIADVVEALLGAIYIDGGYEPAQRVILALWGDTIKTLEHAPQDAKTALQEWLQARQYPVPSYNVVEKIGPDHAPVFVVEVTAEGFDPIRAEGMSRRQAEKTAAEALLKIVKQND